MACRTKPSRYEKLVLYGPLWRLPFVRPAYKRHFLDPAKINEGAAVYAVAGSLLLFRALVFQMIGGFDEATFLYEEELIIGERLQRAGWTTLVATDCNYFHAEAASTCQIPYRRRMYFIDSEQHLLREYYQLGAGSRHLWRLYRYLELIPGFLRTWLQQLKNRAPLRPRYDGC
jgi:N-acetylglucosaminyl-diphospho-decaprenol L-rhamnosyltransferase